MSKKTGKQGPVVMMADDTPITQSDGGSQNTTSWTRRRFRGGQLRPRLVYQAIVVPTCDVDKPPADDQIYLHSQTVTLDYSLRLSYAN